MGGAEVIDRGDRPIVADGESQLTRRRALASVSLCDVEPYIRASLSEHERSRLRNLPANKSIAACLSWYPLFPPPEEPVWVSAIPVIASFTAVFRYRNSDAMLIIPRALAMKSELPSLKPMNPDPVPGTKP